MRRYLVIGTIALLCCSGAAILIYVPKWQMPPGITSPKDLVELENATRRTLAQVLGGAFFLVTAYFTWRNLRVASENLELVNQQFTLARENLRVTEDKQIAERLAKATESLASEKLSVRIGGIYSLERVSRDSIADYWTVMEILTAFVREMAHYEVTVESAPSLRWPTLDVQAAMTVIGRSRQRDQERIMDRTDPTHPRQWDEIAVRRIDLRSTDLHNVNCFSADLWRADLRDSNLEGADLRKADLGETEINRVNLRGARLERASLVGAHLDEVILTNANLRNANLKGAYLGEVDVTGATMVGLNVEGVNLTSVKGLSTSALAAMITNSDTKVPPDLPNFA